MTIYERALAQWRANPQLAYAFADFSHFLEGMLAAYQAAAEGRAAELRAWNRHVADRTLEAVSRIRAARRVSEPSTGAPTFERTGARLVVWLYGKIWTAPAIANADAICAALQQHADASAVVVRIASCGGLADEGQRIAAALDQHAGRTVAVVDKFAFSAATLIACACDRVLMRSDAAWMVHCTNATVSGNADQLRARAGELSVRDLSIERIYARKRRVSLHAAHHAMRDANVLTAIQAHAAGFVDQIIPALPIDWGAFTEAEANEQ